MAEEKKRPVFECTKCGSTFFSLLAQLPANPVNSLDTISVDVYCCYRCCLKYVLKGWTWERL